MREGTQGHERARLARALRASLGVYSILHVLYKLYKYADGPRTLARQALSTWSSSSSFFISWIFSSGVAARTMRFVS